MKEAIVTYTKDQRAAREQGQTLRNMCRQQLSRTKVGHYVPKVESSQ